MIGKVEFELAGKAYKLVLGSDGVWSCPEWPQFAAFLTQSFEAYDNSPPSGIVGRRQIRDVAMRFNGRASFPDHDPMPADTN